MGFAKTRVSSHGSRREAASSPRTGRFGVSHRELIQRLALAFFHLSSVQCGIDGAPPELLTSTSQHLLIDVNCLLMHGIIMCSCVPLELVHLAFQIGGYNRRGTGLFPSSKWARCPRPVSIHGGRWWWPSLFHVDKFNSPTNPGL